MNLETPRCRRCHGRRFFHVPRMRDASVDLLGDERNWVEWRWRPVRASTRADEGYAPGVAIGHFETLICRDCAYTEWLFGMGKRIGGFQLRLCKPCGGVEWYATRLHEIGDPRALGMGVIEPDLTSQGGPYR